MGSNFWKVFHSKKPLIGMIHLPPLPAYPASPGIDKIIEKAIADLHVLEQSGFDGALVENDNDQPHQIGVSAEIRTAFTQIMKTVVANAIIPVGLEIIYDMKATVEVAHEVGATFVRLDVFVDNVLTKWGKIEAQAAELSKLNEELPGQKPLLLTDIQVKHAQMLDSKSITESASDAIAHGSDAIIVTGEWTGQPPTLEDCISAKTLAKDFPVIVGSGLDARNAGSLLEYCDGAIVGTSIKSGAFVDAAKASELVASVKKLS